LSGYCAYSHHREELIGEEVKEQQEIGDNKDEQVFASKNNKTNELKSHG